MRIHALTTCVNYADLLEIGILRWARALTSWTIVTDTRDDATVKVARKWGVDVCRTDAFYAHGATFNKGAAMEEARQKMPWEDWILFLDADIVPEYDWKPKVESFNPQPGKLYSARRRECLEPVLVDDDDLPEIKTDGVGVGYFQLFHADDPKAQDTPLLETCWGHAGVFDSHFMHKWPHQDRVLMPIRLTHVGERDNWLGRGNKQGFVELMAERQRRGGYDHERITV